jgi:hypothetical protein
MHGMAIAAIASYLRLRRQGKKQGAKSKKQKARKRNIMQSAFQ